MADPAKADFATFQAWAVQLNLKWEDVLRLADVTDPSGGSRATRVRMNAGKAPRARAALMRVLSEAERKRARRTEIGRKMLALEDLAELGKRFYEADQQGFLAALDAFREKTEKAVKYRSANDEFDQVK